MAQRYSAYQLQPGTLDDIVGNDRAVADLRKFAKDVNHGIRRKPLLVYGPPGTGKTASVKALATENDWNAVELDASDYRDGAAISSRLAAASGSRNLMGQRNLIVLDEIDELAPKFDKDAGAAISSLVRGSKSPIIFIANDKWDRRISFLRGLTDDVRFDKVPADKIAIAISRLSEREHLGLGKDTVSTVANGSAGDVRSALLDAMAMAHGGDASIDTIGVRDRDQEIFSTLDAIFRSHTIAASQRARNAIADEIDPGMMVNWLEESIPKRYMDMADLNAALAALSTSTLFLARASMTQNYTYWRYANLFMSSGVALAKTHFPDFSARYAFPRIVKELAASKERRGMETQVATKLQRIMHSSRADIRRDGMALIRLMISEARKKCGDEQVDAFLESAYGLSGKEMEWLSK